MVKGQFITLYGINNIGKSTHAKLLVERLEKEGYKSKYVKYPVYDLAPTGPFINEVLRGEDGQKIPEDELQMWFILNRYQFEPQIKKWIEEGYIIVAEDYTGTGIAWGVAKGLDEEWLLGANKYLLKEDFALMLEGERSLSAREETHVHEQNDDLVQKCIRVHERLAEKFGWTRVQVQAEKAETAELIWDKVKGFLV
ncbi:MAG: hypothetical protein AAB373_06345 [Patescibacteria group bacterium]